VPELELIALLFTVALFAGIIDAMVGGGGLLTLPVLLLSGLSPLDALGTNKLQGTAGTATATWVILKKSRLRFSHLYLIFLTAFIGSLLGSYVIQTIKQETLPLIIVVVLALISLYFITYNPAHFKSFKKIDARWYSFGIVPLIGAYDGMFGPGTGSLYIFANAALRKSQLLFASMLAKPLNFATNAASLSLFIYYGHVHFIMGAVMFIAQLLGAFVGAHLLFSINTAHLRLLIIMVSLLMLGKYCSQLV